MTRPLLRSTALLAVLVLGLALRLAPWGQNRFLEDEALYAYWGLQIATGADPMLDYEPVDKPPLHPYALALSFRLLGRSETAARLPSLLASVASLALVYALGRTLPPTPSGRGAQNEGEAFLAALLLALSPFDILFASTAFTDPLLVAVALGALLAAAKGRPGMAGLLAGLAAATKQQGLFFLPLVVAVGLVRLPKSLANWEPARLRFASGFVLVAAGVMAWDLARAQRPGFFAQSLISYGHLGPAQPQALGARAIEWLRLTGYFWGSVWFNILLVGALLLWIILGFQATRHRQQAMTGTDWALLAFVAGFLLLHWLVGFQVWDRYLLGLVPLVALLAGRAFIAVGQALPTGTGRRLYAIGLGLALLLCLAGPVAKATRSDLPVGGDHGAYDGIDELADYMRRQAPPGAVLYHYWLGHHYRFYLYGAPLRLHWYPDLADLAHDAYVYRREPRYIAFPSWRDDRPARSALARAGISLEQVFQTTRRDGSVSFRLYRLEGP